MDSLRNVSPPRKIGVGVLIVLFAIGAAIGIGVAYDVYQDRKATVVIKGVVDLYETHDEISNKKVSTLQASDQVHVLRIRYGKDYQAIKVRASDGRKGWLISGGNFELQR